MNMIPNIPKKEFKKEFDLEVSLSSCRDANLYAFAVEGCRSLARNSCGTLKSATTHTLLAYALLSCLKGIDWRAALRVYVQTGEIRKQLNPSTYRRKLKIRVRLSDAELLDVLESGYQNTTRIYANRANKNLFMALVGEMRRFDLKFSLVPKANIQGLHNWATQVIPSFSSQDMVMPSAVSQLT
jgi:hypothetical protein